MDIAYLLLLVALYAASHALIVALKRLLGSGTKS